MSRQMKVDATDFVAFLKQLHFAKSMAQDEAIISG